MMISSLWSPELAAGLAAMIEQEQGDEFPPLATFDWDNTSIRGDISEAVLDHLDQLDGGSRIKDYLSLLATHGKVVAYPAAATALAGYTAAELREVVIDVIDARLQKSRVAVRPEIYDLYATLQHRGWEVWVVSASAEAIVAPFAAYYGVPAERVIGMRLAADAQGRLLPTLAGPSTFRQGKVDAIEQFIGRRPTFAAGDADTDLEMLHAARYRLVIDRGYPELRSAALTGGWWLHPA